MLQGVWACRCGKSLLATDSTVALSCPGCGAVYRVAVHESPEGQRLTISQQSRAGMAQSPTPVAVVMLADPWPTTRPVRTWDVARLTVEQAQREYPDLWHQARTILPSLPPADLAAIVSLVVDTCPGCHAAGCDCACCNDE